LFGVGKKGEGKSAETSQKKSRSKRKRRLLPKKRTPKRRGCQGKVRCAGFREFPQKPSVEEHFSAVGKRKGRSMEIGTGLCSSETPVFFAAQRVNDLRPSKGGRKHQKTHGYFRGKKI